MKDGKKQVQTGRRDSAAPGLLFQAIIIYKWRLMRYNVKKGRRQHYEAVADS